MVGLCNKNKKMETELELIYTSLKRYTFQSPKIKQWVERNSSGYCLNLFAGNTKLDLNEIRNDIDDNTLKDYQMDALKFVKFAIANNMLFDTVILDPPYAYRKAMEMYNGNYTSKFKQIADILPKVLKDSSKVISFGYHSTFLGKKRGYFLKKLCVFAHGGAQHCTIGIIEQLNTEK